MSTQPVPAPDGTSVPVVADVPVGHHGARVNVRERAAMIAEACCRWSMAWAISGE